jgi:predicted O-methyltransferase YrrM
MFSNQQLFRPDDPNSDSKFLFPFLRHPIFNLLGIRGAVSQHSRAEDKLLRKYVSKAKSIVEIGIAEGASAFALRSAAPQDAEIFLIDPYLSGRLPGINLMERVAHRHVSRSKNASVFWIKAFSFDAIQSWSKPIDFLFIDGDHSYKGCFQDWNDWSPYIRKGGLVAFHDARTFPSGWPSSDWGPVKLVNILFRENPNPDWKIIEEVDSLVVVQRL